MPPEPIRVTITKALVAQDGLDALRRALALAEDLEGLGFRVQVRGQLELAAHWVVRPQEADRRDQAHRMAADGT